MNTLETPKYNVLHPGHFVRSEVIVGRGLSVSDAAAAIKVTRTALSAFLNGRADLSADMALRLEKAFGLSLDMLMGMQCSHDIAQARARYHEIDVEAFTPGTLPVKQPKLL